MYVYEEYREKLFTDKGQIRFLSIRDCAFSLLHSAGAFKMDCAISGQSGVNWEMLACVDRLVELGEIREITDNEEVAGQDRVFVKV